MPARALIINADDLGLWPLVTRGILHAWGVRAISDSTAFATAPTLPEILELAAEAALPVGVHLNLTFGRPVSDPAEIPALVSPDGEFLRREQWMLPLPADQVRLELGRQVRRMTDLGWQPSHLDSHHHVHRYPDVLPTVIELAREYGLPVRAVDVPMRDRLRAAGIVTPDCFTMAFYGASATVDTLTRLVQTCPGETLEIMAHPGFFDPSIPSSYRDEREAELRALTSPEWKAYLDEHEVALVGFGALGRDAGPRTSR